MMPLGGVIKHISVEKRKKRFDPGTLFEAGPSDLKLHALPTELL